jgi:glycosyltransferase involved in cell wall biosynthesis
MHILHIIRSANFAGSERFLLTLARAQKEQGHRTTAVIVPGKRMEAICRDEGMDLASVPANAFFGSIRLARWARENGVDVIHTHLTGAARLGLAVAKRLDIPCVAHLHIYRADRAYEAVARYKQGRLVGVSRHVAAFYEKSFSLAPESIPVAMNASYVLEDPQAALTRAEAAEALRDELDLPEDSRLLLFTGRLSKGKGQDVAIEAMKTIAARHPQARLLLAGTAKRGSGMEATLRRQVREAGLEGTVLFLGFRRDVVRLMRAADLCLMPSRHDVMPLVAVEAMMLGCPLVGTKVCGVPELIEDGKTGILVPPEDAQALAQATIRLLDDPAAAREMGANAEIHAKRECAPALLAERIGAVYAACGTRG